MNIGNEERFHELAHKTLAGEAQPGEQSELRVLIAQNPKLKEEFEQLGAESTVAREILMLLEDLEHPQGPIPPVPLTRLSKQVSEVFAKRQPPVGELVELLTRLEKWAGMRIGVERERIMELISFLRESLSAGSQLVVEEVWDGSRARRMAPPALAPPAPPLSEDAEARAFHEKAEEANRRETEFENRLLSLEARIRQAEEITHECMQEVRGLLEAFARERETSAKRRGQNPNPAAPE